MRGLTMILAVAGLSALAGCGQQSTGTNLTADDINRLGTVAPEAMPGPENQVLPQAIEAAPPASGPAAQAGHDRADARQKAEAAPAERGARPAPPPKASPPAADPHAGHDMGNMAGMNMSH